MSFCLTTFHKKQLYTTDIYAIVPEHVLNNWLLVCFSSHDLNNRPLNDWTGLDPLTTKLRYIFFLLGSHLRLGQWKDDPVEGWLHHFVVITLYQQQHNSYQTYNETYFSPPPPWPQDSYLHGGKDWDHSTNGEEEVTTVNCSFFRSPLCNYSDPHCISHCKFFWLFLPGSLPRWPGIVIVSKVCSESCRACVPPKQYL